MFNVLENMAELLGLFKERDKFIEYLQEEIDSLTKFNIELGKDIDEIYTKKEAAENQLRKLLEQKTLNVQNLQEWYDERFGTDKWFYSYDGRLAKDVSQALRVNNPEIIRELSETIANHYKLESPSPVDCIKSVARFFMLRGEWTYVTDIDMHELREFWAPAEFSAVRRQGDCDSLAILMHRLILDMFDMYGLSEYGWRLKLTAGHVIGEGGHAYNIWLHDDGEWYVIESTYDLKNSFNRTWLKTPVRNNNLYVNFWGFARPDRSWKGNSIDSLEKYEVN
jgi:hypothetical protein